MTMYYYYMIIITITYVCDLAEVRQMRESDIQRVLQQLQARMASLDSQAENCSSQRKDLEAWKSQMKSIEKY